MFDINGPKELFDVIERRYTQYRQSTEKATDDILAITIFVNHLREWIAPEYSPTYNKTRCWKWPPARNEAEQFSRQVFEHPSFNVVRQLCNGTKHAKRAPSTDTQHEEDVLKWQNFLSVRDVCKGPPTAHFVDGQRIESCIDPVMELYRAWFATH